MNRLLRKYNRILLAVFGVGLVIEKLMTISHSNHFVTEYIPVDKVVDQAR